MEGRDGVTHRDKHLVLCDPPLPKTLWYTLDNETAKSSQSLKKSASSESPAGPHPTGTVISIHQPKHFTSICS